jgi:hypothetical protein
MKVNAKQKSAEAWNNTLNKLNSAQEGQIAITYKGKDGKKQIGYIAITDIELDLGKKNITLGKLLATLIKSNNDISVENERLRKLVKENSEQIKRIQEILVKYLPNITI